jgi:hypothetical protein
MMTDGLEQKLPIDAIEEALDVEIEHPVVTPAALAAGRYSKGEWRNATIGYSDAGEPGARHRPPICRA